MKELLWCIYCSLFACVVCVWLFFFLVEVHKAPTDDASSAVNTSSLVTRSVRSQASTFTGRETTEQKVTFSIAPYEFLGPAGMEKTVTDTFGHTYEAQRIESISHDAVTAVVRTEPYNIDRAFDTIVHPYSCTLLRFVAFIEEGTAIVYATEQTLWYELWMVDQDPVRELLFETPVPSEHIVSFHRHRDQLYITTTTHVYRLFLTQISEEQKWKGDLTRPFEIIHSTVDDKLLTSLWLCYDSGRQVLQGMLHTTEAGYAISIPLTGTLHFHLPEPIKVGPTRWAGTVDTHVKTLDGVERCLYGAYITMDNVIHYGYLLVLSVPPVLETHFDMDFIHGGEPQVDDHCAIEIIPVAYDQAFRVIYIIGSWLYYSVDLAYSFKRNWQLGGYINLDHVNVPSYLFYDSVDGLCHLYRARHEH